MSGVRFADSLSQENIAALGVGKGRSGSRRSLKGRTVDARKKRSDGGMGVGSATELSIPEGAGKCKLNLATRVLEFTKQFNIMGKEHMCPICCSFFKDPHMTKCNHAFCKDCILSALRVGAVGRCPTCRTKCTRREIRPDEMLGKLMGIMQRMASIKLKRAKLAEINNDDDDGDVPEVMSEAEDATQSSSYGDASLMTQIEGCTQIARNFGHKNFHRKEAAVVAAEMEAEQHSEEDYHAKRANPMSRLPM